MCCPKNYIFHYPSTPTEGLWKIHFKLDLHRQIFWETIKVNCYFQEGWWIYQYTFNTFCGVLQHNLDSLLLDGEIWYKYKATGKGQRF